MRFAFKTTVCLLAVLLCMSSFCFSAFALDYVTAGTDGETPASESYKQSKYYTYLSDVPLTGDNPTDVLAVALSQLGYRESDSKDSFDGLYGGSKNFTEYNRNFGDYNAGYGYDWCASFVSFCLLQSGTHDLNKLKDWCRDHKNDPDYIWRELGCEKWRTSLAALGFFKTSQAYMSESKLNLSGSYDANYTPTSGDLIFFTESPHKTSTHIGLVLYIQDGVIYTVEGNTTKSAELDGDGDGVYLKSYGLGDYYILGYGDMPYKTNDSAAPIDYSGKAPTSGVYMTTKDIPLYLSIDGATADRETSILGTIPEYSMISVGGVTDDGLYLCETAIDGKTVTGYIYGKDAVVQLSREQIKLNIPPEPPKAPQKSGCGSTVHFNSVFAIISVMLISGIWLLKKKRTR